MKDIISLRKYLQEKIDELEIAFKAEKSQNDKMFILGQRTAYLNIVALLPEQEKPKENPCYDCGKGRTKDQGGEIFTVCDECWNKHFNKDKPNEFKNAEEVCQEKIPYCNADCPEAEFGNCCHPDDCQMKFEGKTAKQVAIWYGLDNHPELEQCVKAMQVFASQHKGEEDAVGFK